MVVKGRTGDRNIMQKCEGESLREQIILSLFWTWEENSCKICAWFGANCGVSQKSEFQGLIEVFFVVSVDWFGPNHNQFGNSRF